MKDSLEDEGYQVFYAYNTEGALSVLHKSIDLIILDVMMPGENGFDLCKKIRRVISCPIIWM